MFRMLIMSIAITASTSAVSAQQIGFDVKDVGVLNHSAHGEGVVIVVQPTKMPAEGLQSPEITEAMDPLCEAFGPRALVLVQEQAGLADPDFVGIRIVSGGTFGRYYFQAYEVVDGGCGAPLN